MLGEQSLEGITAILGASARMMDYPLGWLPLLECHVNFSMSVKFDHLKYYVARLGFVQ